MDERTLSTTQDAALHRLIEQVRQQTRALPADQQAETDALLTQIETRSSQLAQALQDERVESAAKLAEADRLFQENYSGIVIFELERGRSGKVVDLLLRDANPAFSDGIGLPLDELMGRRASDVLARTPALAELLSACQQAAESGQTVWFTTYLDNIGRSISATVFSLGGSQGSERVALTGVDVTEYLQAVQMRRTLQAIMDYTPIGLLGSAGNYGFISRYGHQSLGADQVFDDSRLGRLPAGWAAYTADGRARIPDDDLAVVRALRFGEEILNQVVLLRRSDGQEMTILINAGPVRDEDGQIIGAVMSWIDITERKRAEDQLRYQAMLLDQVHDAVIATDPNQNITLWNKAAEKLYGFRADEIVGHPFGELLLTEVSPERSARVEAMLRSTGSHHLETVRRRKDGSLVYVEVRGRLLYDDQGQISGYIGSHRDVTERKRVEAELRRSEERFRMALENSPIVVSNLDTDLRYTWVYFPRSPEAAVGFLGKRAAEVLGEGAVELEALSKQVLQTGVGERREVRIVSGGVTSIFDIAVEPLRDADGQITGLTSAGMDVTEQRRLEQQLRENNSRAEMHHLLVRQREMERQGIARDLHDGPLQELYGVSFFLAELQRQGKCALIADDLAQMDTMLQQNIQSVRDFCNHLRPPTLAHFGLDKAILTHLENFQTRHPEYNVQLSLANSPESNPLDPSTSMALYRVYQELMNNVIRHSQATEISVRYELDDSQALLEVQDNGVGFTLPDQWIDLARQGHLGLVGMLERLEAVGGRLEVSTRPGAGARVRAVLERGQGREVVGVFPPD